MSSKNEQLPMEIGPRKGGAIMLPDNHPLGRRDPIIVKKQPEIISRGLRPMDLLYALRRRWALCLGLGLFVAAITLLVAWLVIPVRYNAHVWLRVAKSRPKILYNTQMEEHYLNDRNAQATLIRSSIVLGTALQQPGIAQLDCLRNEKDKTNWLASHLNVGYLGGTEILQIAISGEKPEELVKILLAVRQAYMEEVVAVDRDMDVQRRSILERAYKNLEKMITRKEIQYKNLADQLGAADSRTAQYANIYALENVSTLRGKVNELRSTINGMDRRIALLNARMGLYPEAAKEADPEARRKDAIRRLSMGALSSDSGIMELRNQLVQLTNALKIQVTRVKDPANNPSIKRLKARIEECQTMLENRARELMPMVEEQVQQQMAMAASNVPMTPREKILMQVEEIKLEREVLQKELETNLKTFQNEAASAERLSSGSTDLDNLRTEIARMKSMYNQMGSQLEQWAIEQQAAARVQTINEPELPKINDMDRKLKMMGFLGLMSFVGTVIAVSGFDFLGRRVNSSDELSFGLGIHVMGDLPLISRGFHRHYLNQSIQGLLMESIDNIRTALLHRAETEHMKAILVTSSLEKEGKTTVSSQLAASLARTGRKVILVDADLRRPSAHRMFDRPLNPGLAEFLRKKVTLDEVITTTRVENLWIIPAGTPHPEAIISLAQGGMDEPMKLLREQFDFIVVDSGPVLTDADVLVIGRLCDGVIVSVLRDVSRIPWVYEACERLRTVDIPLVGTVLNGVSFGKYRPYYSSYTIEVSGKSKSRRHSRDMVKK
ncbi:MAG: polysaccharide biosynthesis tyrosine autokinase [Planctomycetia bacterium]|nr:polysaccharide biosynthesis tyrosine autokinase [Planctomycetia bacterium]